MWHFFFSSRRRHTRYWRDWSSDVCSSDLGVETADADAAVVEPGTVASVTVTFVPLTFCVVVYDWFRLFKLAEFRRSEERRVGKECRSRRAPNQQNTKWRLTARASEASRGN